MIGNAHRANPLSHALRRASSPERGTMNKPIKAKNLPLFSIIDLDQLRRENHLEGTEVTDFFTARDGKVYLLMEQPSETQGNAS